jgi:hypothetical protein
MKTGNFCMGGFPGRRHFGFRHGFFFGKWSKMTNEEKKAFVEKQVNLMDEYLSGNGRYCSGKEKMTVEDMNQRFEKWQKMSSEEKETFVNQKNERTEFFFGRNRHHRFCF